MDSLYYQLSIINYPLNKDIGFWDGPFTRAGG